MIPTIHVKDLAKIVKLVIDKKPEQKYIFAVDQTADRRMKSIVSSISRGIGTGITHSYTVDASFVNNLKFTPQDFYINSTKHSENKLNILITDNELKWQGHLNIDIMLKQSKIIDEDFEWHCKEGIPANIPKLLQEFTHYRKLRPLKIVLNCEDKCKRFLFAEKLSFYFNIPILNYEKIMEKISLKEEDLTEEEQYMNQRYVFLRDRLQFIENNPDYKNEANELLFEANEVFMEILKYLLKENDSMNRGYVLEGMPVNLEEVFRLYNKKEEIVPEEGDLDHPPEEEEEEYEEVEKKDDSKIMEEKVVTTDNKPKDKDDVDFDNYEENEMDLDDIVNMGEMEKVDDEKSVYDNEGNKIEKKKEEKIDEPIRIKKKKKKKIIPKKYKNVFDQNLLPESVITILFNDKNNDEVNNMFWEVEKFYQENNIEVLNLLYDKDHEEMVEMMRIYVERVI